MNTCPSHLWSSRRNSSSWYLFSSFLCCTDYYSQIDRLIDYSPYGDLKRQHHVATTNDVDNPTAAKDDPKHDDCRHCHHHRRILDDDEGRLSRTSSMFRFFFNLYILTIYIDYMYDCHHRHYHGSTLRQRRKLEISSFRYVLFFFQPLYRTNNLHTRLRVCQ